MQTCDLLKVSLFEHVLNSDGLSWPAWKAALTRRNSQTRQCSLTYDLPLKLRYGGEDVKDEFTHRRRSIDFFSKGLEFRSTSNQCLIDFYEMPQRAAHAI